MNIQLNLATQPFRRDRPVIAAGIFFSVVLAALLALQVTLTIREYRETSSTRAAIAAAQDQLNRLASEQAKLDSWQTRPESAELLARTVFLNGLIYRKAISWTRIFSDLEQIMPEQVRLVSIRPWLNGRNEVVLEMTVGATSPEPIVNFVMKLEGSDQFGATTVANSLPPSQTDPLYKYKVNVRYAQKF